VHIFHDEYPHGTLQFISTFLSLKRRPPSAIVGCHFASIDLVVDPIRCITRIANQINLNQKVKQKAINIINAVTKSGLSAGKNPMGLAASILYMSCLINGCDIGQTIFAQTAGVTEVTIINISTNQDRCYFNSSSSIATKSYRLCVQEMYKVPDYELFIPFYGCIWY
jgi:transcription initiation factor TFIIIB Brf1 subunit/transcription initiation factor TFIIB